MQEFVKEGYFLRGGIDAGWFVDSQDIAIGTPLATAYKLETEVAINPRIVLSENFQRLVSEYLGAGKLNDYSSFLADKYLKQEASIGFLNPFFYITNYEEKESKLEYLKIYSDKIKEQLITHASIAKILSKYKWFAGEFNTFIDLYLGDDAYKNLDNEELEYSPDEIAFINSLKI